MENEFFCVKKFCDKYVIRSRHKDDKKNKYDCFLTIEDIECIIDGDKKISNTRNKIFKNMTFIDHSLGTCSSMYARGRKKDLLTPIFDTKQQANDFLKNTLEIHMMRKKIMGFSDYAGWYSDL